MKSLLLALSLVIGLSACTPSTQIESKLAVIDEQDNVQSWTVSCDESASCKLSSVTNARSMYMGDNLTYTCSLNGDLYMSRQTYRAMTNLEQVKGVRCIFHVSRI